MRTYMQNARGGAKFPKRGPNFLGIYLGNLARGAKIMGGQIYWDTCFEFQKTKLIELITRILYIFTTFPQS